MTPSLLPDFDSSRKCVEAMGQRARPRSEEVDQVVAVANSKDPPSSSPAQRVECPRREEGLAGPRAVEGEGREEARDVMWGGGATRISRQRQATREESGSLAAEHADMFLGATLSTSSFHQGGREESRRIYV